MATVESELLPPLPNQGPEQEKTRQDRGKKAPEKRWNYTAWLGGFCSDGWVTWSQAPNEQRLAGWLMMKSHCWMGPG